MWSIVDTFHDTTFIIWIPLSSVRLISSPSYFECCYWIKLLRGAEKSLTIVKCLLLQICLYFIEYHTTVWCCHVCCSNNFHLVSLSFLQFSSECIFTIRSLWILFPFGQIYWNYWCKAAIHWTSLVSHCKARMACCFHWLKSIRKRWSSDYEVFINS